ncbi:unnamed protein product, partial [Citrullus colocynthis]
MSVSMQNTDIVTGLQQIEHRLDHFEVGVKTEFDGLKEQLKPNDWLKSQVVNVKQDISGKQVVEPVSNNDGGPFGATKNNSNEGDLGTCTMAHALRDICYVVSVTTKPSAQHLCDPAVK